MSFHLIGVSQGPLMDHPGLATSQLEPLSLGRVELGASSAMGQAAANYGAELVGVWAQRNQAEGTYLVLEGELEADDARAFATELDLELLDFRMIVVPESAAGVADEEIRVRLEIAGEPVRAIGPELQACPECGGYGGLHFSPPHAAGA